MSLEIIDRLLPDKITRIGEEPCREVSAVLRFWRVEDNRFGSPSEMELAVITWEGLEEHWDKIEQRITELQSAAIPGVRVPTERGHEGETGIFLLPLVGTPIPEVIPPSYTMQELETIGTQLATICDRLAQENICHEGIVVDALFWDAGNRQVSLEGAPWAILASISQGACMPYDLFLAVPPEWEGDIESGTPESDQYALGMALAYVVAGKTQAQQLARDLHGEDEGTSERAGQELRQHLQGHSCPAIFRSAIPALLDRDPAVRESGLKKFTGDSSPAPLPTGKILLLAGFILVIALILIVYRLGKVEDVILRPDPPDPPSPDTVEDDPPVIPETGQDLPTQPGPRSRQAVWGSVISGIKDSHGKELPVSLAFVRAAKDAIRNLELDSEKTLANRSVSSLESLYKSCVIKQHLSQWLGADTDRQVKQGIESRLRKIYEQPFEKEFRLVLDRYLRGVNKAVETWRKHAQRDISFREFRQQALTLDRRDGPHDGGLPEGKAIFLKWCDEIEKLKVVKVEFLEGTCTGSTYFHREIHLTIGGTDLLEKKEKHTWSQRKGKKEYDYEKKLAPIAIDWKPGDEIKFILERDSDLNFLGWPDINLIDQELGGPVSLWRLRVKGFFEGNEKRTRVTLRVLGCPGPPNSLSRTDIAIGKDLLGLE